MMQKTLMTNGMMGKLGGIGMLAAAALGAATASASAQTCADHGIPVNGMPKWEERAMLVLTNACRISPVEFRNYYIPTAPTILQPSVYPAVPPLQCQTGLSEAARAHSVNLATTPGCPLGHSSCNGVSMGSRFATYYPNSVAIAENVAGGYLDPLSTIRVLLLDKVNNYPAPDGTFAAGHRTNIMSANYTQMGNGHSTGTNQYMRYWTQDFGKPTGATTVCSPISSGSHILLSGEVIFLVNYYDAADAAPQSARVVIDGVPIALTLHLGTAARGTYRYAKPLGDWGTGCRSYHFEFTDAAGAQLRYPTRGEYRTYGEAGCGEDYIATSFNPPAPCPADFNGSGGVTVDDLFGFMGAWFAGDTAADFNGAGGVTVDDLFGYMESWFTGCP